MRPIYNRYFGFEKWFVVVIVIVFVLIFWILPCFIPSNPKEGYVTDANGMYYPVDDGAYDDLKAR